MAEVYLVSVIDKSLALARRICDVVSAGVSNVTPEQNLNPKKLERLFKQRDIYNYWPQKGERLLLPEDVIDFNYIFSLNGADGEAPYRCWSEENPDEAEEMWAKSAEAGKDWKAYFKAKVMDLSTFRRSEDKGKALMDPVQPGGNIMGVRHSKFEKAFEQIKDAIDRFLLKELKFSVETKRFVKVNRSATIAEPETS
jgi:protein-tyrosine-phosphatase